MYIGCGVIAVSSGLQIFGNFCQPPLSTSLNTIGIGLNMVIIPATIIQAQKSASETQEQFGREQTERDAGDQRVWEMTEPGQALIARNKLLHDMHKAE